MSPAWAEIASTGPTQGQLKALARQVRGPVITPGSSGYARDRLVFDTLYNSAHPKAIVHCESTTDVQKTVRWARKYGVRLVPRSGGHSYGGYSTTSAGVVVDVSRMNFVQARAGGTALIGAGAMLIDVYSKLWNRHLMIPGGSCPTVGIAGLALGGGLGWSARKFGTTADNVSALTIVTADGKALVCNAHQNADLYWACRGGGGGNFGIVSNFTFRTHRVGQVTTFYITWPWSHAARVVRAWQAWAPHAPAKLGLSVCELSSSPLGVSVGGQFFGSPAAVRSLIRPLLNAGSPSSVSVTPHSFFNAVLLYAGCDTVAECRRQTSGTFKGKSDYLTRPMSAAGINALIRWTEARNRARTPGAITTILEAYGGAINKVPTAATAFAHRHMLYSIQYYGGFTQSAARANIAFMNRFYKAMRPYVSSFAYQNYIDPQLPNWAHAYYGPNYPRLVSVKRRRDPSNFFHFAQSIRLRA